MLDKEHKKDAWGFVVLYFTVLKIFDEACLCLLLLEDKSMPGIAQCKMDLFLNPLN
jgi:hypothetical protein